MRSVYPAPPSYIQYPMAHRPQARAPRRSWLPGLLRVFWGFIKLAVLLAIVIFAVSIIFPGQKSGSQPRAGMLGISMDSTSQSATTTLQTARITVPWQQVEPQAGKFQWQFSRDGKNEDLALAVQYFKENNVQPVMVLTGGPAYLQTSPEQPVAEDDFLRAWDSYIRATVNRFGDDVDAWQIGDRINTPAGWGQVVLPGVSDASAAPDPALYARMLRSAYEIIKQKDASDTVILGSLAGNFETDCQNSVYAYLSTLKLAGAWVDFDVVAFEPVSGPNPPEVWYEKNYTHDAGTGACIPDMITRNNMIGEVGAVNDLLTELGHKPIWITNLSWDSAWLEAVGNITGQKIAQVESDFLVRSIVPLISNPDVERIFPVEPGIASRQTLKNLETTLHAARPLKSFQGVSALDSIRDEAVYEYRFQKNGGVIIYIWRTGGVQNTEPVTLQGLDEGQYHAYTADTDSLDPEDGVPLSLSADGSITLLVGNRPMIVIGTPKSPLARLRATISDQLGATAEGLKSSVLRWIGSQRTQIAHKAVTMGENFLDQTWKSIVNGIEKVLYQ